MRYEPFNWWKIGNAATSKWAGWSAVPIWMLAFYFAPVESLPQRITIGNLTVTVWFNALMAVGMIGDAIARKR